MSSRIAPKPAVVLTAFGTSTHAFETYRFMDTVFRERFPDHAVEWAFSSRMVRDRVRRMKSMELKHPHEVLAELHNRGHGWAVVQSLHLMCGHEFYRLVSEAASTPVRTAMGLPLLCEPEDYKQVADVLLNCYGICEDSAIVLVGHGTDHPCWTAYLALQHVLREKSGQPIFIGVVEGDYPDRARVIHAVKASGFRRVRLIPLMLVAGVHFLEDLTGPEDSWKSTFEAEGITVSAIAKGLGFDEGIVRIFCDHIQAALDTIPQDEGEPAGLPKPVEN